MSDSDSARVAAPARSVSPPQPPRRAKAPRTSPVQLKVVAEICPQVFPRTLDLIAQRGLLPLSMEYERRRTRLYFAIAFEGLSEQTAAILAAKVAALVRVRSARWVRTG